MAWRVQVFYFYNAKHIASADCSGIFLAQSHAGCEARNSLVHNAEVKQTSWK